VVRRWLGLGALIGAGVLLAATVLWTARPPRFAATTRPRSAAGRPAGPDPAAPEFLNHHAAVNTGQPGGLAGLLQPSAFLSATRPEAALEAKLAAQLSALDWVDGAEVLLDRPDADPFERTEPRPRVAVTVQVRPGGSAGASPEPSPAQVAAAARLLSWLVPGLQPQDLLISEASGEVLFDGQVKLRPPAPAEATTAPGPPGRGYRAVPALMATALMAGLVIAGILGRVRPHGSVVAPTASPLSPTPLAELGTMDVATLGRRLAAEPEHVRALVLSGLAEPQAVGVRRELEAGGRPTGRRAQGFSPTTAVWRAVEGALNGDDG